MRVFISIPLSDDVKNAAMRVMEDMKRSRARGSYVAPENLHLTLAFIGETDDITVIEEALDQVIFKPFTIETEGFGHFGNLFWIGLKESAGLRGLAAEVRKRLSESGIPFDRKSFKAHITLARRVYAPNRIKVRMPQAKMEVRSFSLMRSDRIKGRMKYTELGAWDAQEQQDFSGKTGLENEQKILTKESGPGSKNFESGKGVLLESPRLRIRQITEADKNDYLYGASLVSSYKAAYQDEELSRELWQDVLTDQDSVTMIIYERESGRIAGTCSFDHWKGEYPEIGINVDPDLQNLGLGTETVGALTDYYRRTRPGEALLIRTRPDNLACQKMIKKCGGSMISTKDTGGREGLLTFSLPGADGSLKDS